jgi:hypothetical protein
MCEVGAIGKDPPRFSSRKANRFGGMCVFRCAAVVGSDSGQVRRNRLHESSWQRAAKAADQATRIAERADSLALRGPFPAR